MGKPIAQHQLVAAMLADMETKCEAARGLLYKCGLMIDEGAPADEITKISAMAKLYCTDVAMEVTTDAVQVLGGYGYMREYPVERMMRDAKITQIYEGTNQIQRLVIARQMLKENRRVPSCGCRLTAAPPELRARRGAVPPRPPAVLAGSAGPGAGGARAYPRRARAGSRRRNGAADARACRPVRPRCRRRAERRDARVDRRRRGARGHGRGDSARGRERRCGLRWRGVPLVRSRAGDPEIARVLRPARRAGHDLDALVGDRAAPPRRGAGAAPRAVGALQSAAETALGRRIPRFARSNRCGTNGSWTRSRSVWTSCSTSTRRRARLRRSSPRSGTRSSLRAAATRGVLPAAAQAELAWTRAGLVVVLLADVSVGVGAECRVISPQAT